MTCSRCWMPRSPGSRVHCHRKVWPVTISVGDYKRAKWPVTRVLERFYVISGVRWHAGQKMYCHRESPVALGLQARWQSGRGNLAFGVLTVSHTINCRTWEPGRGGMAHYTVSRVRWHLSATRWHLSRTMCHRYSPSATWPSAIWWQSGTKNGGFGTETVSHTINGRFWGSPRPHNTNS